MDASLLATDSPPASSDGLVILLPEDNRARLVLSASFARDRLNEATVAVVLLFTTIGIFYSSLIYFEYPYIRAWIFWFRVPDCPGFVFTQRVKVVFIGFTPSCYDWVSVRARAWDRLEIGEGSRLHPYPARLIFEIHHAVGPLNFPRVVGFRCNEFAIHQRPDGWMENQERNPWNLHAPFRLRPS